jgi:hypothetical protein
VNGQPLENDNIIELKVEENKIYIYPDKFENPDLDEIYEF